MVAISRSYSLTVGGEPDFCACEVSVGADVNLYYDMFPHAIPWPVNAL